MCQALCLKCRSRGEEGEEDLTYFHCNGYPSSLLMHPKMGSGVAVMHGIDWNQNT